MDSPPAARERSLSPADEGEPVPSEPTVGALGAAFTLGVVAGAAGAMLLMQPEEEPAPPPPRRFLRRVREAPATPTLSDVVHHEAATLVRGLFRELGGAATRLILDLTTPPLETRASDAGDEEADAG